MEKRVWKDFDGSVGAVCYEVRDKGIAITLAANINHIFRDGAYVGEGLVPYDLGVHIETPQWEGEELMDCCHTYSGKCSYEGSGHGADHMWKVLQEQGEEALWEALIEYMKEEKEIYEI